MFELMSELRYYYSFLNDEEKDLYQKMFYGILQRKTSYQFTPSKTNLNKVLDSLIYDCPELYNVNDWSIQYNQLGHLRFSSSNPFFYSEAEENEINTQIKEIASLFPLIDDDYQNEVLIHRYIARKCVYDRDYKTHPKESRNHFDNHCMVGPLFRGKGVCSGLSRAAQFLLYQQGVPSIYCRGILHQESSSGPHGWLIVKIHGNYYHLDMSNDTCLSEGKKIITYKYFNLTDSEIKRDHTFNFQDYPGISCDSTEYNYYMKNKKYYFSVDKMRDDAKKTLENAPPYRNNVRFTFRMHYSIPEDDVLVVFKELGNSFKTKYSYFSEHNVYSINFNLHT